MCIVDNMYAEENFTYGLRISKYVSIKPVHISLRAHLKLFGLQKLTGWEIDQAFNHPTRQALAAWPSPLSAAI